MDVTATLLLAVLSFGFGFVNCFFGYRIVKTLLLLWGFVLGALLGWSLVANSQPVVILIVAVIAGVIGALVMRLLYTVGVFLLGAAFGITIGLGLMGLMGVNSADGAGILILLAAALLGGILALAVQKLVLILFTAFSGAGGMVNGVLLLVPGAITITTGINGSITGFAISPGYAFIAAIATLLLTVVGVLFQYRADKSGD